MLDASGWDRVVDRIKEEDFYRRDHQLVFRAIASLIDANHPCDVVTVSEWLDGHGDAKVEGGLAYIAELAESTPSAANVAAYAEIVRERAVLREMIATGSAIADRAYRTEGRPVTELVEEAEQLVYAIGDRRRSAGGPEPIRDVLVGVFERIDELHQLESDVTGVPTGFIDLDRRTAGLQRGDLIVVAGRPSMGKTALALNIVESAAIRTELGAIVFSMEMSSEQLTMRFLSALGGIDSHKIRTGKLEDADWPRLTSAMTMLNESRIFLDDSGDLTPTELRARCRRLKREHDIGLVVVDYLHPDTRSVRNARVARHAVRNRNVLVVRIRVVLRRNGHGLRFPPVRTVELKRGGNGYGVRVARHGRDGRCAARIRAQRDRVGFVRPALRKRKGQYADVHARRHRRLVVLHPHDHFRPPDKRSVSRHRMRNRNVLVVRVHVVLRRNGHRLRILPVRTVELKRSGNGYSVRVA